MAPFTVLILGGASGTGKTSLSYPLARHYGVNLTEADDFQVLLEALTTPETFPSIHYWDTHPDWPQEGAAAAVARLIDVGRAMGPGLAAIVRNHLDENTPIVLEGDFLLPELAAAFADEPRVKALFVHEPDQAQIEANYLAREPQHGLQRFRAEISAAYSRWLAGECLRLGVPVLPARPWDSTLERAVAVLGKRVDARKRDDAARPRMVTHEELDALEKDADELRKRIEALELLVKSLTE